MELSKKSERQEAVEASWPWRVIETSRANTTMLGTALLAILYPERINLAGPSFGPTAALDAHGQLWTQGVRDARSEPKLLNLGPVSHFIGSLRTLADELKLTDDERIALFTEVKKWIAYDAAAIADVKL